MRPFFIPSLVCAVALLAGPFATTDAHAQSVTAPPVAPFTKHINEFPSLWQKDPRGDFKGDGSLYCVPVATSNGLMWLAENGFPNLLPHPNAPRRSQNERALAQVELVHAVTADGYAPLRENSGTSFAWMARGIRRYVTEKGYALADCRDGSLVCDGAPPVPVLENSQNWRVTTQISLSDAKAALHDGAIIILSIGRYSVSSPETYTRTGGHALTLVGYGSDAANTPDPNVLIVHDPSRTRGGTWPNTFIRLSPLTHGNLVRRGGRVPPLDLTNRFYEVSGEESVASGHLLLLDGVFILRLQAPLPLAVAK